MIHFSPRFILPLAGLLLLVIFGSCAPTSTDPPAESETTTAATSPTEADTLRAHYEAMLSELKAELLTIKQDNYIARSEYEARIKALEAEIALLCEDNRPGSDIPVSGNGTPPNRETDKSETEAETEPPVSSLFYYDIEDGQAVIYKYIGENTEVVIPAAIQGYPVVRIADGAFQDTRITRIDLPDSVTKIGWFAFAQCTDLSIITIPASVSLIEYAAFDGCPQITFRCYADSYAAKYAVSFGLRHEYI